MLGKKLVISKIVNEKEQLMPTQSEVVGNYVSAFVNLNPENADTLYELIGEDIFFSDPFNQTQGKSNFKRIFDHMFETCENPKFNVSDIAHSDKASYLRWQMTGKLKNWPHTKLLFDGMTEIHLDERGKINWHIDHWDSASQLMSNIPFIGLIIRPILKLFRLRAE